MEATGSQPAPNFVVSRLSRNNPPLLRDPENFGIRRTGNLGFGLWIFCMLTSCSAFPSAALAPFNFPSANHTLLKKGAEEKAEQEVNMQKIQIPNPKFPDLRMPKFSGSR